MAQNSFDMTMIVSRRHLLGSVAMLSVLPACGGRASSRSKAQSADRTLIVDEVSRSDDQCDGVSINRAIEQVHARGGGIVQLSSRTYNTSVPILLRSHVTLKGNGPANSRIKQVGTIERWAHFAVPAIITTDRNGTYEDVHLEGFALLGLHESAILSDGPLYAKSGVAILNAKTSSIRDCAVSNVGTGIGFFGRAGPGPHRNLIEACTVKNASSWVEPGNPGTPRGITMATDYSTVRNCSVDASHTGYYVATEHGVYENCSASGWRDDGFYVNANYCRIENCRAVAATHRAEGLGSGYAINPSKGNVFIRCVAMNCGNAGMRFRHAGTIAPSNNQVLECSFVDCGYGFLDDMTGTDPYPAAVSSHNEFLGNTAEYCQFCGFLFIRQTEGIFRKNRAISNNRGGITVQNVGGISFAEYCSGNVIEDNICDDNQKVKTQKWGLYIYPKSLTGASVENTGNKIRHYSAYGIDVK